MRKSMRTIAGCLLAGALVAACGREDAPLTGPAQPAYEHGMIGIGNNTDTTIVERPGSEPQDESAPELAGS